MKNNDHFDLDIQIVSHEHNIPEHLQFKNWIETVLKNNQVTNAEIGVRVVDEAESANLNKTYRFKTGPTNVLSFPLHHPVDKNILLGDLVFCAPVINKEAKEQDKAATAHWAHLVIHGMLHLLGYDHIEVKDRTRMESLEIKILDNLGYDNPYENNYQ